MILPHVRSRGSALVNVAAIQKLDILATTFRCFSSSPSLDKIPVPTRLVSITQDQDLIERIPLEDVRSFSLIAHVDHGKSSLASRFLEITGNMGVESQKFALEAARSTGETDPTKATTTKVVKAKEDQREQIGMLDTLSVERQRGITVKASTASMLYPHPSAVGPEGVLLLNMIDTPGHADFGREVSRSLSFVQGAILLLDATQGIQAQTWTVHEKAKAMDPQPELILAMTKIDLDAARPIHVALSVSE